MSENTNAEKAFDGEVIKLSNQMREAMGDGEHGKLEVPKDLFENAMADQGVSADEIKKYQQAQANVVAGFADATAERGMALLKKDKSLDRVEATGKLGKDQITTTYHRKKDLPDGNGGMKPKYGVLGAQYKTNGQQGSKGQLKKVREHWADKAKTELA